MVISTTCTFVHVCDVMNNVKLLIQIKSLFLILNKIKGFLEQNDNQITNFFNLFS
jgi:hypothetical protein